MIKFYTVIAIFNVGVSIYKEWYTVAAIGAVAFIGQIAHELYKAVTKDKP